MRTESFLLLGLSAALLGSSARADITSGLIAHWTFDETSGLAAADTSGRGNNATLFNFPADSSQWVPGVVGGALFFNGELLSHDDYVLTDQPITFTNQQHQYTFSFWIKRMSSRTGSYPRVISPVQGGFSWWVLWGQGGGVGMSLNPLPSDSDPMVGEWIHYAVEADQDAKTYSVYSNTVPVLTSVADGQGLPGTAQWMIGHTEILSQAGDYWIGALDDVRIYDRLLAAGDVQELFNLAQTTTPTHVPVFVQQPQGADRPATCSWSTYAVANGDPAPLAYQWRKNGADIDGATDITLSLVNLQLGDAGTYTLVASNAAGTATSQPAVLQVHPGNAPGYESGMVAHWTFDEKNGMAAADSSLCGGSAASLFNFQTNSAQWVPGVIGGGLFFNGDILGHNDYVQTDGPLVFADAVHQYSFSFWIKRMSQSAGTYPRVISPNNQWWVLWGQNGGMGMNLGKIPGGDPAVGQWTHYVLTADVDAKTYSVYSNNVPQLTDGPSAGQGPPAAVPWVIGHNEGVGQAGDYWIGVLDDVRVYNRLLNQTDVQDLYNLASTLTPTNPPVFVRQPQGGLPTAGFSLSLFGTANGDPAPLAYQWQKNGTNLAQATGQALVLNNLQLSDSGTYVLIASNVAGVAYSQPAVVQVQPAPLVPDFTNGLMAWWKFDEAHGLVAADSSGLSNSATLFNYVGDDSQWTTGRVGGALRINILGDGNTDPNHADYVLTDQGINLTNQDHFAFAFWIKREPSSIEGAFPRIISPYNVTHWILFGQGGGPGFYPPVAASAPEPLIGAWEHFIISFDRAGGTYNVYRNGIRTVTGAATSKSAPGLAQWIIAHNESPGQPGDEFFGELDDLRIYNRLFSDVDAQGLFDSAPAIQPTIGQQSVGTYYEETGQPISFFVRASGGQLKYQWQKAGQNITGATTSTLTLSSVQPGDAGTYRVIVSNSAGTATGTNVVLLVSAPGTVDLAFGLVADWRFDETTGLVAADASGRTNNLMLINYAGDDSQWVTGRIGGALTFNLLSDGSVDSIHNAYAVTGDGVDAQPINLDNQDQFSFSFWINRTVTDSGTFPRVISPYRDPAGQGWVLWGQNQGMGFYPQAAGSHDPALGAWEHYVVTYERDTGVYNVYQNGVQVVTGAAGPVRTPPGANFWMIGHNENPNQAGDYWVGAMDDVRIYNRLLTAPDVAALAKLGGIVVAQTITITPAGQNVILTWPGGGALQSASQITGPWGNVSGAPPSPYTVPATGAAQFFRIRQ